LKVYRISSPEYVDDFSGIGASLYGGRWNPTGMKILYTAQTASLAILELLANIKGAQIPYQLIEINVNSNSILSLDDLGVGLPSNWSNDKSGYKLTQKIGSDWLKSEKSALLKVPSVHNPFEHNILINPHHAILKLDVSKKNWYLYDYRLAEGENL